MAEQHIAKFYTKARRFPRLVGKLPDGTQIPFGPFTLTQVVGGAIALFIAAQTIEIWGTGSILTNATVLVMVAVATVFLLGLLPKGSVLSPLALGEGVLRMLSPARMGTLSGSPVRAAKPHKVTARVILPAGSDCETTTSSDPAPAEPEPSVEPAPVPPSAIPESEPVFDSLMEPAAASASTPEPQEPTPPPLTEVQRLLASIPR